MYRVIKEFPAAYGLKIYKPGDKYDIANGERKDLLIENGFIEPIAPIPKYYYKLANIHIADCDYVEGDKKHFTFDEALAIEKKLKGTGWRLPTRHEWALISEEFGLEANGKLNPDLLVKNLNLVYGGSVYNSTLSNAGYSGYYWSATANSASNAYNLYFSSSSVYPSDYNARYYGYSVRLVKEA